MKNTLLFYQGGSYPGCFWEWNFCFWDANGVWHDLYSSGKDGIKSEGKALIVASEIDMLDGIDSVTDLTNKEAFRQFQQHNNAGLVLQIAQELNENYDYNIELTCCECECSFVADRSEGDIAIDDDEIVCYECLVAGTCDCCNEYVGDTELIQCNDDGDDDVGAELADLGCYNVCNDCFEYHKELIEIQALEDLRFQAFCTGEPDIFSEELREYWKGN